MAARPATRRSETVGDMANIRLGRPTRKGLTTNGIVTLASVGLPFGSWGRLKNSFGRCSWLVGTGLRNRLLRAEFIRHSSRERNDPPDKPGAFSADSTSAATQRILESGT